ncbi:MULTISPECIES: aspartyl-phosphate phosphatase Spo0E family protein [Clostridium]|uniref:Spo0E family sporulation regulatory protein-aspartic acid phosphatase n=1 Tax=Clostridium paridis TaxID=2803863 RepID=A0A937FFJ7_9CLOT|nr:MULTISPECIES: aspartyl-phosphate phosphatase Spo0E family protein [Clostridium]MBL4933065.1 Spo0E family sporulation regulatory protein-aspartic acid phosphatase [Clostridium paridis]
MSEAEDLLKDIETLREQLENTIKQKQENLINFEVISVSRMLNSLLNKYNETIK